MLIALFLWSVGTAMMWYEGHRRLPLVSEPEIIHGWRAIVELARAMESELRAADMDITTMTDDAVKREVGKKLRGGAISYEEKRLSRGGGQGRWKVFLGWVRKEKWWIGGCAVCVGVGLGLARPWFGSRVEESLRSLGIVFWSAAVLIVGVLWLGSTVGSRLLMLVVSVAVAAIICFSVRGGKQERNTWSP